MERQIWVDFNEADEQGQVFTLAKFAEKGVSLDVGALLIAGDDEGNRCKARIVEVRDNGLVALQLDGVRARQ